VVDLKVELEKRGLSKSGTKNQLAERLINYLDSHSGENRIKICYIMIP